MFSDLFARFFTSLSPHLRALGYLDEALAMRGRARRNSEAWKDHLDHTCRFILSSAENCGRKNRVVILGSGLLLDVPLAELSSLFREVVLLDVVCLPEVRQQIQRYPNVVFREHDTTEIAEALYLNSRRGVPALPAPQASVEAWEGAGLVVSLNILSQLWVVPRAFVGRSLRAVPSDQVDDWCARIVEAHLDALRASGPAVCLVSDHTFVKRDRDGAVISRGSTVYDLALPEPDASWSWNIVPIGKDSPHAAKELLVGGWYLDK